MQYQLPDFNDKIKSKQKITCIDGDKRFKNLPYGYWIYDELLKGLYDHGWFRFAAGFKAALYGNPKSKWCIKLLGMGVGDNPLYFCNRGYYLEHERNMLIDFQEAGFSFQPKVMTQEESVKFLVDNDIVNKGHATLRVQRNDLLVMELIDGVPFATQTGHHLDYTVDFRIVGPKTLSDMYNALYALGVELDSANSKSLLHNDPMPPNIIFCLQRKQGLVARLVDFEIAQNLSKPSPDYVSNTVSELYNERLVPKNPNTGKHIKNLDQHLVAESIQKLKSLPMQESSTFLEAISFTIPYTPISVNLGKLLKK